MTQASRPRHPRPAAPLTLSSIFLVMLAGEPARAAQIDFGNQETIDNSAQSTQPNPWDIGDYLQVNGAMIIGEDGSVSDSIVYLGGSVNTTTPASVTVAGTGAQWRNSGGLFVGDLGNGKLTVGEAGTVSDIYAIIGSDDTAQGTVTVSGASALWDNSDSLTIATYGQGTLSIGAGGTVRDATGSVGTYDGANGMVAVAGDSALWASSGNLVIGGQGTGEVDIGAGGTVSDATGFIGSEATGNGTVLVQGDRASWQNTGDLVVGSSGIGQLTVGAGGTVTNQTSFIGSQAGAIGTVAVSGADALWRNDGVVVLGSSGRANLTVDHGALASAPAVVIGAYAGSSGTLTLGGATAARGTLETALVQRQNGAGQITFDGGLLKATADETDFLSGFETGDLSIQSGGAWIDSNGHDIGIQTGLQGTGGLAKTGTGTLTLSGDSTYTGETSATAGTLIVNGSLADSSLLTVAGGATLGGSGTVGDTAVAAGGTLSPGNSIGTLTVDGDLTFDPDATYNVQTAPNGSASDRIQVTGQAHLNGASVAHIGNDGDYRPATVYTILSANGGLDGSFGTVTTDYAFLIADLFYDANTVYLQLVRDTYTGFSDKAATDNQAAAANGAESLGPGNALYTALLTLPGDDALVRDAFDQLAGEIHASTRTALIQDSHFLRDAATDRLRIAFGDRSASELSVLARSGDTADGSGKEAWSHAYGSWSKADRDGGAASLDYSSGGLFIGGDAPIAAHWRLGLLAGYGHTKLAIDDRNASAGSDDYHLGVYGGGHWDALRLTGGLGYTWHHIETDRRVAFDGFNQQLSGRNNAATGQIFGEAGYRLGNDVMALEPFAGLARIHLRSNGQDEDGGSAALATEDRTSDTTFGTLGLHAATNLGIAGMTTRAHGTLGWRHAFGDTTLHSTQAFTGGQTFTVTGVAIAEDAALLEAGLDFGLNDRTTIGFSYSGQIASHSQENGIKARLDMRF